MTTPARRTQMMTHPETARQLAAGRQQELLGHARRHRQARTARTARTARPARQATAAPARPSLLGRVHAALTSR